VAKEKSEPRPEGSDWLTVEDAATKLGCSLKTVRRLTAQRRDVPGRRAAEAFCVEPRSVPLLDSRKELLQSGPRCRWRLVVSASDVNRLLAMRGLERQESALYLEGVGDDGAELGGFGTWFVFLPPGERWDYGRLPKHEIPVSLLDAWRLAWGPADGYDSTYREVRSRIPGAPDRFEIRFKLDSEEVQATLERIVRGVRLPRQLSDSDRRDAVSELRMRVLSRLDQVSENPEAYLRRSVENFYLETLQRRKNELAIQDLTAEGLDPDTIDPASVWVEPPKKGVR
jgi:DNA-directed RNA polymerase specialized sigma24 family protein